MSLVWNPPPQPPQRRLLAQQWKGDIQVAAWKHRRGLAGHAHEDPSTLGMSENALAFILQSIEQRRSKSNRLDDHLHKAMAKFTPALAQPTVSGVVEAMAHIWAQPEMLDMWSAWESGRSQSARGPQPSDAGAKATLATLGMTGHTHGLDAYSDLLEKPELLRVFARVDAAAAARAGDPAPGPLPLRTYRGSMKRFDALCERSGTRDLVLATKAKMFRALMELHPDRPYGRGLLIDGCLFPAWCEQIGTGTTAEMEAARRRTTPYAGARHIVYTKTGKQTVDPGHIMSASRFASSSNFDRGYYYVAIIDQASGWPLVSLIMDAELDEAEALIPLLSDLYRHYPFLAPEFIAGDGAWDEGWAHRACELYYGLAPVFRHTERAAAETVLPGGNQSNTVKGFTHDGQLKCMDHNQVMPFDGFERAPRGDLRPGRGAHGDYNSEEYRREEAQRENQFRVRALHGHGPGPAQRVSLKASVDWRRLNAFPRHPNGKPALYAERMALGMRLKNQMEGHFSRMQGSLSLLTKGADRVRLQDWDKVEMLLHLAELRMNALSLAAERAHNNVGHTLPTGGDVAPLPEFPFGCTGRLPQCRASTTAAARATTRAARAAAAQPAPRRHAVASALTPATATAVVERERNGQPEPHGNGQRPGADWNDWSDWEPDAEPDAEPGAELAAEAEAGAPEPESPADDEPEAEPAREAVPAGGTTATDGHAPSPSPSPSPTQGGVLIAVDFANRRRA